MSEIVKNEINQIYETARASIIKAHHRQIFSLYAD